MKFIYPIIIIFSFTLSLNAQWGGDSKPLIHYYTTTSVDNGEWRDLLGDLLYKNFSPDLAVVAAFHAGGDIHSDSTITYAQNFNASLGDFFFNDYKVEVDSLNLFDNIELFQGLITEWRDTNNFEMEFWGEYIKEADVLTFNSNYYSKDWFSVENEIYGGTIFLQHNIDIGSGGNLTNYNHSYRFSYENSFGSYYNFLPIGYQWDPDQSWGNGYFIQPLSTQSPIIGGSDNVDNLDACHILYRKENDIYHPFLADCLFRAQPNLTSSTREPSKQIINFTYNVNLDKVTMYFVESHEEMECNIYDLLGKKILSKTLGSILTNSSQTIDISQLISGSYILQLSNGQSMNSEMFFRL